MSPAFPYLCALRFAMGTLVDNGGCYFNGEIKNWIVFRQTLCRSSDGMGLGWIYEIANVLSAYLQKAVAEMSKKDREVGGIVTDFAKFSDAQLKKVVIVVGKSQGSFLLKQALIKHHKDTFGSNYMERTLSRAIVSSLCSFMMPSTPKDPSSQKLLPSCKVCSMAPWSRRFSKARLLVMRSNGAPMSG